MAASGPPPSQDPGSRGLGTERPAATAAPLPAPDADELTELRQRVDALERRLAGLERELGIEP